MSSVPPPALVGPGDIDAVTQALGSVGTPVDCTGLRNVPLEGPHVLWLVTGGWLDLFAVDVAQEGHWHFLGRLEAGTLLLGPVAGPQHTLLGRPSQDCRLRRIPLRELPRYEYGEQWDTGSYPQYGTQGGYGHDPAYGGQGEAPSALEHAFALGTARSLGVLFEAPLDGRPADEAVADDDILWMPVPPGSVQYGAS
ncbi:NHLP bacteriocin export ABC transporter permease/ATPase subunit, partial [Streptomyces decoyicus]